METSEEPKLMRLVIGDKSYHLAKLENPAEYRNCSKSPDDFLPIYCKWTNELFSADGTKFYEYAYDPIRLQDGNYYAILKPAVETVEWVAGSVSIGVGSDSKKIDSYKIILNKINNGN